MLLLLLLSLKTARSTRYTVSLFNWPAQFTKYVPFSSWEGVGGSRSDVVPSGSPNLDTISEQYVDINLSGFATGISLISLLTKTDIYFFIRLLFIYVHPCVLEHKMN